jgi:hypothetical protein
MSIIVIVRDGRERCPGFHSVPKVLQVENFVYIFFFIDELEFKSAIICCGCGSYRHSC